MSGYEEFAQCECARKYFQCLLGITHNDKEKYESGT